MSKSYTYTIRDRFSNEVVATGAAQECADILGLDYGTIVDAAKERSRGKESFVKKRYISTRSEITRILPGSKYYSLYFNKTGELVCAGSTADCAEILGLPDHSRVRTMFKMCEKGECKKWSVVSVPYETVSPDLTPIPPTVGPARSAYRHYGRHQESKPRDDALWYSLYLRKTDEMVCSGTAGECAKALGLKSYTSFHSLLNKIRNGINKKYEYYSEPYYEED